MKGSVIYLIINNSKHISILVLFFITSVSCFVFFCWIFESNSTIFLPQGLRFRTFFVPAGWEFALSKNSLGGWSGLELTDTLPERSNYCIDIHMFRERKHKKSNNESKFVCYCFKLKFIMNTKCGMSYVLGYKIRP